MSFETALAELAAAGADDDLDEVISAILGMSTFAALLGDGGRRDQAVAIAAELLSERSNSCGRRETS
jgi:hypothetical protein